MVEIAQNKCIYENKTGESCVMIDTSKEIVQNDSRFNVKSMEDNKKQQKIRQHLEFRYYEMPSDTYLIALLGERWILNYGREAMHFHNYLEIGYCYYGDGCMILGDRECRYEGGVFTVIPRNFPHRTRSRGNTVSRWEYLFIDVEGFLNRQYRDRPAMADRILKRVEQEAFISTFEQNEKIAGLIADIIEEMRSRKELYKESVTGYLIALLSEISRLAHGGGNGHQTFRRVGGQGEERVMKAMEYIAGHYREEIRVSSLAEMCHVSETHFRRIFEKITHTSPLEYINMVRIQNACILLTDTSDSVEEIRAKVGFPTASTFNRNFRKLVKMSPGEWRRQEPGKLADYEISIYKGW